MHKKQVFVDRCMQMSGPFVCTVMETLEVFQGCSQINTENRNSLRLVDVAKALFPKVLHSFARVTHVAALCLGEKDTCGVSHLYS